MCGGAVGSQRLSMRLFGAAARSSRPGLALDREVLAVLPRRAGKVAGVVTERFTRSLEQAHHSGTSLRRSCSAG